MSIAVPRLTAIASTLLWFAAALLLLLALSLGLFAASSKGPQAAGIVPLIMLLWALAYGAGGYALRKQKWGYRWWPLGLGFSSVAVLVVFLAPMTLVIFAVNIIALILSTFEWRKTMS